MVKKSQNLVNVVCERPLNAYKMKRRQDDDDNYRQLQPINTLKETLSLYVIMGLITQ